MCRIDLRLTAIKLERAFGAADTGGLRFDPGQSSGAHRWHDQAFKVTGSPDGPFVIPGRGAAGGGCVRRL
jgi:hypothetical protein